MKKRKIIAVSVLLLATVLVSANLNQREIVEEPAAYPARENKNYQPINMAISHGHCCLPFEGVIENLKIDIPKTQVELGKFPIGNELEQTDPLYNMKVSFEVNPNSFKTHLGDDYTERLRTDGLFKDDEHEKMLFTSTNIFKWGKDWYMLGGKLSIKGIEKDVFLRVTPIFNNMSTSLNSLVINSQIDLFDFEIDYDKMVDGKSNQTPNKWMFINMKVNFGC